MRRADIHFHLLPGIDDGPAELSGALELAQAAVDDGTEFVVATPHVRPDHVTDVEPLAELAAELRRELVAAGLPLHVVLGGELCRTMVGRLRQYELEKIALGPPGARWLLLETPFEPDDGSLNDAASELRDRGFAVVLAHPERHPFLADGDEEWLWREVAAGAVLQVSVWSLAGAHGEAVRDAAVSLLRSGAPTVIASDAHPGARRPLLSLGVAAAREAGVVHAERLAGVVPTALLAYGIRAPLSEAA